MPQGQRFRVAPLVLSRVTASGVPGSEAGRASGQVWGLPGQVWKSCGDYGGINTYTRSPWNRPGC